MPMVIDRTSIPVAKTSALFLLKMALGRLKYLRHSVSPEASVLVFFVK
jgi:hypothetical protein